MQLRMCVTVLRAGSLSSMGYLAWDQKVSRCHTTLLNTKP